MGHCRSYISLHFLVYSFFWQSEVLILMTMTINKIVEEKIKEQTPDGIDPLTLMSGIAQQFDMNGIREINPADRLTITNADGVQVVKKYEVRHNFIGNIDLVVHFEKTFNQKALKAAG